MVFRVFEGGLMVCFHMFKSSNKVNAPPFFRGGEGPGFVGANSFDVPYVFVFHLFWERLNYHS